MVKADLDQLLASQNSVVVLASTPGECETLRKQVLTIAQGDAHLEMLTVLPLEQWLVSLWDASFPPRQVLRPVQLLALARTLIEDSDWLPEAVLNSLAIARRFVDAFELAERYELSETGLSENISRELLAFSHWRQALREQLQAQGAISAGQLPLALCEALEAGLLELPQTVALSPDLGVGPAEQRLLEACGQSGVNVCELLQAPPVRARLSRVEPATVTEEVTEAARWVADRLRPLERAGAGMAPRLALVVADTTAYEEPLRRALEREAYPYTLFPQALSESLALFEPWPIGGGRLAGYPVIATAVDLLQLATGDVPLEQLSRIVRSSFVAEAEDQRSSRAQLDWYWRENLPGRTTLRDALFVAGRSQWPDTIAFLQAVQDAARYERGRVLPSNWVRRFDAELLAAGWPNREAGDSVVDQCRQGFSQVMDTLRALDRQLGEVDRNSALFWLQHILQGKRFELRRDEAPLVQILSLDEVQGQHFDGLWLLGLSDNSLPRPPEPQPFLPRDSLRLAGVPRADASDCLRLDRALVQQLLGAAAQVVLSCPQQSADGVEQSRSHLLPWSEAHVLDSLPSAGFELHGDLAEPDRDGVRGVGPEERSQLRGGSGIFRDYAASPFLAFLKYRLGLRDFPLPVEGLDPATQGAWVHRALELFWRQTANSEQLAQLSEAALRERVEHCVEQVLAGETLHGDELLNVEKRRLISLLVQWLAFEQEREEAFEVESTEWAGECDAFGIPLRLRIDRIDRIGDHRLIIDYKTGMVLGNKLNADNLREPQLPLYALFAHELLEGRAVDGVALAQVNARYGMSVHMRSSWSANLIANKRIQNPVDTPEKWQGERKAWSKVLQEYAEGFVAGVIDHDYSLGPDAFPYDPYVTSLAREGGIADD